MKQRIGSWSYFGDLLTDFEARPSDAVAANSLKWLIKEIFDVVEESELTLKLLSGDIAWFDEKVIEWID